MIITIGIVANASKQVQSNAVNNAAGFIIRNAMYPALQN